MAKAINKTSPKVLGLDVSTKTIGWSLFDIQTKELLELTHISPVPKPKVENKIEELILKGHIFRKKIEDYVGMGITNVVIDDLDVNQLFLEKCVYTHNFNNTQSEIADTFHGVAGCNGTITFEFSTPIYLWLLENM